MKTIDENKLKTIIHKTFKEMPDLVTDYQAINNANFLIEEILEQATVANPEPQKLSKQITVDAFMNHSLIVDNTLPRERFFIKGMLNNLLQAERDKVVTEIVEKLNLKYLTMSQGYIGEQGKEEVRVYNMGVDACIEAIEQRASQ